MANQIYRTYTTDDILDSKYNCFDLSALDAKDLSSRLSTENITYQVYHVPQYAETVGLYHLISTIYNLTVTSYNDDIHIVLLCADACVSSVMHEVS